MQILNLEIGEELLVGSVRVTVLDIDGDEVLLEVNDGDSVHTERLKVVACD